LSLSGLVAQTSVCGFSFDLGKRATEFGNGTPQTEVCATSEAFLPSVIGDFMPAKIEVERVDATHFRVRVVETGSQSTHQVTLDPKERAKFGGEAVTPEELIRKSFEFLLEREPKESILERFDLPVISRYFPEYEREIKRRLL
jgi:hypothetical protein